MLGEHQFDAMTLLGSSEARRAVVCDDRQLALLGKVFEQGLTAGDKRAYHPQVTLVNRVIRLHGAQVSIVEAGHDE